MKKIENSLYKKELRERAEEFINKNPSTIKEIPPDDVKKLIEDLQIHQVELEMQNEELRLAQLELEATRDKFLDLYNFAPVGYFSTSDRGMILEANFAGADMLGVERGLLMGTPFSKFINRYDQDFFYHHRRKLIETKNKQTCELRFVKKDGPQFHAHLESTPVLDADGNINQFRTTVTDISEHKKAEDEIATSRDRLDSIIRSIPDIIYRLDADGRITFISDSVRHYGYIPEKILGSYFLQLVHPEDRTEALRRIEERRERVRGSQFYEVRLLTKNRNEDDFKIFSISAEGFYKSEMPSLDSFLGTQGIARDITDKKMLEDQLNQARTMQAIGTLAGGIAHDFNNLLMAIQGYTSIMTQDLDPGNPYYEMLENIEEYVGQGSALTKQLLGLAKGGKYVVKPTDLNDLIKNHNRIFSRTKKEITIHETYERDLCLVNIDEGQIQQVFMNFYVNAYQAMPNGGDLYVQTEIIFLDEDYAKSRHIKPGRYVKVSVTDTGFGMDKDTQKRIFDPFFTTKNIERGTGLGLASVYGIIKNHEGMINVYSEKGKGTTFNIYLPTIDDQVLKREEKFQTLLKGSETVLLVDDEEMVIEVGKSMMEILGYKVFTAHSGKEAIDIYNKSHDKIDLVILDMIMPKMDGGKTYKRLKEINPNITVLLSSGYSMNGAVIEILDQGCNGFMQKPFNVKQMANKIREILD